MRLRCTWLGARCAAALGAVAAFVVAAAVGVGVGGGCHEPTGPRTIANADPAVKIPAMKQAVAERDRSQAAAMIKDLDSDDPAVRLFAIEGLQRLTGENFGYEYYAPAEQRAPAVAKWKQWLEEQPHH